MRLDQQRVAPLRNERSCLALAAFFGEDDGVWPFQCARKSFSALGFTLITPQIAFWSSRTLNLASARVLAVDFSSLKVVIVLHLLSVQQLRPLDRATEHEIRLLLSACRRVRHFGLRERRQCQAAMAL